MLAGEPLAASIDLSRATKLKNAVFRCRKHPQWIATTLRTITCDHKDLQQIDVDVLWPQYQGNLDLVDPARMRVVLGGTSWAGWSELDRVLGQIWESYSIRLKVPYSAPAIARERARGFMERLLPEVTRRGIVELVEDNP